METNITNMDSTDSTSTNLLEIARNAKAKSEQLTRTYQIIIDLLETMDYPNFKSVSKKEIVIPSGLGKYALRASSFRTKDDKDDGKATEYFNIKPDPSIVTRDIGVKLSTKTIKIKLKLLGQMTNEMPIGWKAIPVSNKFIIPPFISRIIANHVGPIVFLDTYEACEKISKQGKVFGKNIDPYDILASYIKDDIYSQTISWDVYRIEK